SRDASTPAVAARPSRPAKVHGPLRRQTPCTAAANCGKLGEEQTTVRNTSPRPPNSAYLPPRPRPPPGPHPGTPTPPGVNQWPIHPRAKSLISCGTAASKPTTSIIPLSFGSAIEKPELICTVRWKKLAG